MKNSKLFSDDKLDLFIPEGIEYIHDVLNSIGFTNYTSKDARVKGLETIKKLLNLKLIEIFSWGKYNNEFKDEEFSTDEIIMHLRTVWFEGADFSDFISMPMFKYKDWYVQAQENAGLTHTTNWKWFVKSKIGDLEQWIEEHRPKDE